MIKGNQLFYSCLNKHNFCNNMDFYKSLETYCVQEEIVADNSQIIEMLELRDLNGNIQIEEGVVLPHIKDTSVQESKIIIVNLEQPIKKWSSKIARVDLIIVLLIKEVEEKDKLEEIVTFMRQLADEEFIEKIKI